MGMGDFRGRPRPHLKVLVPALPQSIGFNLFLILLNLLIHFCDDIKLVARERVIYRSSFLFISTPFVEERPNLTW